MTQSLEHRLNPTSKKGIALVKKAPESLLDKTRKWGDKQPPHVVDLLGMTGYALIFLAMFFIAHVLHG